MKTFDYIIAVALLFASFFLAERFGIVSKLCSFFSRGVTKVDQKVQSEENTTEKKESEDEEETKQIVAPKRSAQRKMPEEATVTNRGEATKNPTTIQGLNIAPNENALYPLKDFENESFDFMT